MIAPLTDVQSSDCQMVLQNSDPFHHDRYHHHHHCQLHHLRSDCDHICADVRLFDVESLEFEERKKYHVIIGKSQSYHQVGIILVEFHILWLLNVFHHLGKGK